MLGRLQPGGTGFDVLAASMPDEESAAGILDATEVLLVDSAREFQALVTFSDGSNGPPSGAGPYVAEVLRHHHTKVTTVYVGGSALSGLARVWPGA
jgi:hypothetical protein